MCTHIYIYIYIYVYDLTCGEQRWSMAVPRKSEKEYFSLTAVRDRVLVGSKEGDTQTHTQPVRGEIVPAGGRICPFAGGACAGGIRACLRGL